MLTSNHERPTQASPISKTGARFGTKSSIQHPKLAIKICYLGWLQCKNMEKIKETNRSLVRVRPRPRTRTNRSRTTQWVALVLNTCVYRII